MARGNHMELRADLVRVLFSLPPLTFSSFSVTYCNWTSMQASFLPARDCVLGYQGPLYVCPSWHHAPMLVTVEVT